MRSEQSIIVLLNRLWLHLSVARRTQFFFLLILMIIASFAEVISIAAVLPFLAVLSSPEHLFSNTTFQPVIRFIGISTPEGMLLPLTIIFGISTIFAGGMRIMLIWFSTKLSFAAGADFSLNIYQRTLYQPYSIHCSRNSSEIISGISNKANGAIYSIIVPTLTLISSLFMLIAILSVLFIMNPMIAFVAFSGLGLIYYLIIKLTRKKLLTNSYLIAHESNNVIRSLQEGLGGIRDVLIDGCQALYCQIYRDADVSLRRAQGNNFFLSQSPRYGMEALGMLLIAVLAYTLTDEVNGISQAIPMLGALALGAQRLLPVLQQLYSSWSNILGGEASLYDTLKLLDQPLPKYFNDSKDDSLQFKHNINFKNVSFRYQSETPYVLKKIDLNITKGSCIGFIGKTGSGKSTLLDIVMALLSPTKGNLSVDGVPITASNFRSWQANIAHVPQSIFLSDNSIEENIAFGVPKEKIDRQRVQLAAQMAQISDIIETWPQKFNTFVGERGVRLSGGQRQRIGIARALYKQANVIIFDEATSALDTETEQAVMESIQNLDKNYTILIIAHRLTTLKKCTKIVELSKGSIKRIGSYNQIMSATK